MLMNPEKWNFLKQLTIRATYTMTIIRAVAYCEVATKIKVESENILLKRQIIGQENLKILVRISNKIIILEAPILSNITIAIIQIKVVRLNRLSFKHNSSMYLMDQKLRPKIFKATTNREEEQEE